MFYAQPRSGMTSQDGQGPICLGHTLQVCTNSMPSNDTNRYMCCSVKPDTPIITPSTCAQIHSRIALPVRHPPLRLPLWQRAKPPRQSRPYTASQTRTRQTKPHYSTPCQTNLCPSAMHLYNAEGRYIPCCCSMRRKILLVQIIPTVRNINARNTREIRSAGV